MKRRTGLLFLFIGLLVGVVTSPWPSASASDAPEVSADRILAVRSVVGGETPQWSPDGSQIMFASGLGGKAGLWGISPEGGFPRRLVLDLGGIGFLASQIPRWSPDGNWLAYVSDRGGTEDLWLWSARDGRNVPLTKLGGHINSLSWSPDGRSIAFAGDRYGNYDIWKVAVPDGTTYRLTEDQRYEVFPTWTPDSSSILYVRLDDRWVDHDVIAMSASGEGARVVVRDENFFDYGAGGKFGYPRVSPDGSKVLFRSHRSGWLNYWTVPLAGGEPATLAEEQNDQSEATWSPDGSSIAYIANQNGTHSLRVVSANGGAPRTLVQPTVGRCANPQWSPDGRSISFTLATPTRPRDLHVVAVGDGAEKQLTFSTPAGNLESDLIEPAKITYQSFDGLLVHAYLYKPETAHGERVPGIVFVHGGPTSQFHDTIHTEAQFLAQNGYVVLLPNIRGSSGYGRSFEDANNRDWGHGDLKDVVAGADYLKTLAIVNPDKMGITGTSYGGCMSMSAVGFAPGRFQAAIPMSGYADWFHFYEEQELRHIKLLDFEFGPLDDNEEVYRRSSPIFSVRDVTTPTFLIHGEGRFPRSEASRKFAQALEKEYKTFRYKTYPNETYYVRGLANTRQKLLDMLDFFDEFLKDQVASPSVLEAPTDP